MANISLSGLFSKIVTIIGYKSNPSFNEKVIPLTFIDQDNQKHLIFTNNKYYTKEEVFEICNIVYNTVFDEDDINCYRSNKWYIFTEFVGLPAQIINQSNLKLNISIVTVASILMCIKPKMREPYNIPSIISKICYILDK